MTQAEDGHFMVYINGLNLDKRVGPSGIVYICDGIRSVWIIPGTWYDDSFDSYWDDVEVTPAGLLRFTVAKSKNNHMSNLRDRALEIERIVCKEYCDDDIDAADLALDELHQNSNRTNTTIAHVVAQRIMQE